MKIIFTFFLAIIFSIAQGQIITFQKTYRVDSTTIFNQVTPLAAGGYIACGTTKKHYLVVKMDQNGQVLWSKQIGDSINTQTAYRIGEMIGGGYYLLGLVDSTSSGTGVVNLLKLDASGNTIWNKVYVANDVDDLQYPSIRQIANGDFIISASFTDGNSYGEYYMMIKTDNTGNLLWSTSVAPQTFPNKPKCYDIEESYNHNAYTIVGDGYYDGLYAVSCGVNGNLLWAKRYSDLNSSSFPGHTIAKTNDGGYIVSTNADDYGFKPMLVKLDSLGNFLWSKSYVNSSVTGNFVGNTSVSKTTDGGFILASLNAPTSPTTAYPYLIKTNGSGNIQWAKYYTLGKDVNSTFPYILVKQTSDKGYVIAANSYSTGSGTTGWVIKTDSLGKTACNYSVVTLSDSIIVLNTTIPALTGPSVTANVTTYTTANVTVIYPLSCINTGTTSTDTTHTDTTIVTTRIITQIMGNKKISIYPNPSNGQFTIQKGDMKINEIEIYNMQGEKINQIGIEQKVGQMKITFDISTQPKGIYILKIAGEDGVSYSRLVLQ